jgi:hypothetical protein
MITRLLNILLPHKLVEMILAWIFPVPEKTKEEKIVEVMIKYFDLINDIPCDEVTIRFYDDDYVEIYLIYNSWERAYENIKQEDTLEVEMGDMFPYRFVTSHLVSEV